MPDVVVRPLPMQDWDEGDPEVIRLRKGETPMQAKRRLGFPIRVRPRWLPVVHEPVRREKCWVPECWDPATETRRWADDGSGVPEVSRFCHAHAHAFDIITAEHDAEEAEERRREPQGAPFSREAHGLAGTPRNRPDRPSKTPEGRQAEYAKRNASRQAARAAASMEGSATPSEGRTPAASDPRHAPDPGT